MLVGALIFVALFGDLAVGQTCQADAIRRDCGKNSVMDRDFPSRFNFLCLLIVPWLLVYLVQNNGGTCNASMTCLVSCVQVNSSRCRKLPLYVKS